MSKSRALKSHALMNDVDTLVTQRIEELSEGERVRRFGRNFDNQTPPAWRGFLCVGVILDYKY